MASYNSLVSSVLSNDVVYCNEVLYLSSAHILKCRAKNVNKTDLGYCLVLDTYMHDTLVNEYSVRVF